MKLVMCNFEHKLFTVLEKKEGKQFTSLIFQNQNQRQLMTHSSLQYKVKKIVLKSLQAVLAVISRQTNYSENFLKDPLHSSPVSLVQL